MAEAQPKQTDNAARIDAFIARWQGHEGGQERANYALFLTELCSALGLQAPDVAEANPETNDYVFERVVKEVARDGAIATRRMDLYKRGCFVLEAKQSRQKGGEKEVLGQSDLFVTEAAPRGRRGAERAWDVLMMNARRQAEDYVRLLPANHEPPPFIIVCDVGHCFEVYSNFRLDGKAYDQFPDRRSFRIFLEDLRKSEVRDRFIRIWSEPQSLDPARNSARVTREIAERLAAVSRALELAKRSPEEVAMFLMRALFTMFAEDIGLLPEKSFKEVLERCEADPETFVEDVGQLWAAMNDGGYAYAIRKRVPQFNGEFFRTRTVLPIGREEIGELRQAASYDWRDVEPAIFGTLLEQALDPKERKKLGAHYTPRAYVERLVVATIIDPLREEWGQVLSTAERQKAEGRSKDAEITIRTFHDRLCKTLVLDPACGTGNFLYVSLELLKRLEGEVLEALVDLGGQEALSGLAGHTVDPHQFLGMEINPRAAAIAELVLWIGHLQWHVRTKGGMPSEPILRAFKNIVVKDAVLIGDGASPGRPEWPPADFIVGNPPFIGGKDIRARLGEGYAKALWTAHPHMNESADFVMYWWDRAAELLTRTGTMLRRFGLVTTNSISQEFSRRVIARRMEAKRPVSLLMAIPDHPWTKATDEAAQVRIAMTVAVEGIHEGVLREVVKEENLNSDEPLIGFTEKTGFINSDLTIGVDVTKTTTLLANKGLGHKGFQLNGDGFIMKSNEIGLLDENAAPCIKRYFIGRDINQRDRGFLVIDLFPRTREEVRKRFPKIFQYLLDRVKPERVHNPIPYRRDNWWLFGQPSTELRSAQDGLRSIIITARQGRHRIFSLAPPDAIPESTVVVIAIDDNYVLGVLHSRIHEVFSLKAGGWLGVGNDTRYFHTKTFDTFPFPSPSDLLKSQIAGAAKELNAFRKERQTEHPTLTLTQMYNVLEKLKAIEAGETAGLTLTEDEERIRQEGLILILMELHEKLDRLIFQAYDWPVTLSDDEILLRLVALNKERAQEEARGHIRWLRPDYQISRFGSPREKAELELVGIAEGQESDAAALPKAPFPADDVAQTAAVMAALATARGPQDARSIASSFRHGRRNLLKVEAILTALARMGVIATSDGGRSFSLRRTA